MQKPGGIPGPPPIPPWTLSSSFTLPLQKKAEAASNCSINRIKFHPLCNHISHPYAQVRNGNVEGNSLCLQGSTETGAGCANWDRPEG